MRRTGGSSDWMTNAKMEGSRMGSYGGSEMGLGIPVRNRWEPEPSSSSLKAVQIPNGTYGPQETGRRVTPSP